MNRAIQSFAKQLASTVSLLIATGIVIHWNPSATSQDSDAAESSGDAPTVESVAVEVKEVETDANKNEPEEPPYTPKSKLDLQRSLSAIQYKVTQMEETEPAFRNKYWDNKKEGIYRCIVCGQSLFTSEKKYTSGTGWPSFYDPIKKDNIGLKTDFHLFYPRKEVHCSRCSAHLGHVFDDGPKDKTGKRYCMNSAALRFEPKSEKPKRKAN